MIHFLSVDLVKTFHNDQIARYGGIRGVRDENLLESAVMQAQISFGGEYVNQDIHTMAAAYGFHICKNHPFLDGNKRTALIAMYVFLSKNGFRLIASKKQLYALILKLAQGEISKEELTNFLQEYTVSIQ